MKNFRKKACLLIIISGMITSASFAQLSNIGTVLSGGKADAEMILTEYIRPYASSLGANLNGGWYNTAKPHKLGGFDITLTLSAAIVPSGDRSFNANSLTFASQDDITTTVSGPSSSPTAAGDKKAGQTITYTYDDGILPAVDIASYTLPKGTGSPYFLSPMIQGSVGLMKETEIILRYMPQTKLGLSGGTKAGLWGVGVKHSLSQWIPLFKRVPVVNISLMGAYTQLSLNSGINVTPEMIGADDGTSAAVNFDNQALDMKVGGYTVNLLVSADLPVITIYGGAGISNSKTSLMLEGYYPAPDITDAGFAVTDNSALKNPIDISIESKDGSATKPRLNAGLRLKFAVVTFHADYTYANYSVATVGLGVALR